MHIPRTVDLSSVRISGNYNRLHVRLMLLTATVKFGIPLQSDGGSLSRAGKHVSTNRSATNAFPLDWMMFAAAATTDDETRNSMISMVHTYIFTPQNNTPIGPIFDPTSGENLGGSNRFGVTFVISKEASH